MQGGLTIADATRASRRLRNQGVLGTDEFTSDLTEIAKGHPRDVFVPDSCVRRLRDANVDAFTLPHFSSALLLYLFGPITDEDGTMDRTDLLNLSVRSTSLARAYTRESDARPTGGRDPPIRATVLAILRSALHDGGSLTDRPHLRHTPLLANTVCVRATRTLVPATMVFTLGVCLMILFAKIPAVASAVTIPFRSLCNASTFLGLTKTLPAIGHVCQNAFAVAIALVATFSLAIVLTYRRYREIL